MKIIMLAYMHKYNKVILACELFLDKNMHK